MSVRDTSMEAYQHLREEGKINDREQNVLNWVDEYNEGHDKDGTAREIHEWLAVKKGNEKAQLNGPNYIKPRITDLKDKGYIEEGEKRECSVSGRKAYEVKTVAKQETLDEEEDIYVDEDGNQYVFNPNTDRDQTDDESSESLVSNQAADGDSENCSTTNENKRDDEDDNGSTQTVLMQDGEVVG